MAKLINLRTARKQKNRDAARAAAKERAVKSGLTKSRKTQDAKDVTRQKAHLDGHKRDR